MPPMGNQHAGHVHGAGGAPGAQQQLCRELAAQIKEEEQEISSPLVARDPASERETKPRACRSKKEAAGAGPSGSISKKRTKRRRPGRPCKIGPCPEKHMFNRFIHKLEASCVESNTFPTAMSKMSAPSRLPASLSARSTAPKQPANWPRSEYCKKRNPQKALRSVWTCSSKQGMNKPTDQLSTN